MAYAYTVSEVDPDTGTDFVIGIFTSLEAAREAAETARKEVAACFAANPLAVGAIARGVYHSVTAYQIGKIYR